MSLAESFERLLLSWLSPAGSRARLLILTYHRVLPQADALMPDEPDAEIFAAQIEVLGKYCKVLPLPHAIRGLKCGSLPQRAACITFDDGYANNLHVALPVLEANRMSATVFMAVDAIRRGIMWNDLVIEAVRAAPGSMDVSALGMQAIDLASTARSSAIDSLLAKMKYLPLGERWLRACDLYKANAHGDAPRLMLQEAEVAEIARRGHDVGAHTVNHPILRELAEIDARREIEESGRWVADVIGSYPKSFAYPNGRPDRDYNASHVSMVRDAGFELAVSTSWGCASGRSDIYQLPRCAPWDLRSRLFSLRLAKNYLMYSA